MIMERGWQKSIEFNLFLMFILVKMKEEGYFFPLNKYHSMAEGNTNLAIPVL